MGQNSDQISGQIRSKMKQESITEKDATEEVVKATFEDWVNNHRMKSMKSKFKDNIIYHHTNEEFLN